MFSKTIIDSDLFLDMPLTAQALYFHLSLRADDEGFINSPKKIMRMTGTRDDDLKILITKQFIIPFESGVVIIRHWLIHNSIRKDRIKTTFHKLEKESVTLVNNIYELGKSGEYCLTSDGQSTDNCQQNDRIGLGLDLDLDLEKKRICQENKNQFSDESVEMNLTKFLFNLISKNMKTKTPDFQKWANEIRLMISSDKRNPEHIKPVISYSQNNEFWKRNIRSTAKLRKHFEKLYMEMVSENKKNKQEYNNNYKNNNGGSQYEEVFEMFE
jgi:hypothetical protein